MKSWAAGAWIISMMFMELACVTANTAKREEVDALKKELRDQRERQMLMERRVLDMDARMSLMAEKLSRQNLAGTDGTSLPKQGRPALGMVKLAPPHRARPGVLTPPLASSTEDGAAAQLPLANVEDSSQGMLVEVDHEVLVGPGTRAGNGNGNTASAQEGSLNGAEEEVVARTDPKTQYNLAMRHYKARQYQEAAAGFEEVADRWPEHNLADNAVYWTGVCYLAQGEMALAINELQKVPVRYPGSDKVPDALFQLSEAYLRVGDQESAKAMLTQVVELYPKAQAAGPAREHLAKMQKP